MRERNHANRGAAARERREMIQEQYGLPANQGSPAALQVARFLADLSCEDAAESMGISTAAWVRRETGTAALDLDFLRAFCERHGVPDLSQLRSESELSRDERERVSGNIRGSLKKRLYLCDESGKVRTMAILSLAHFD